MAINQKMSAILFEKSDLLTSFMSAVDLHVSNKLFIARCIITKIKNNIETEHLQESNEKGFLFGKTLWVKFKFFTFCLL